MDGTRAKILVTAEKKKGGGRHYTDPFLTKKVRPDRPFCFFSLGAVKKVPSPHYTGLVGKKGLFLP